MNKTALIVGSSGQDGKIALEYLVKKGYSVIGIDKDAVVTENPDWKDIVDISKKEEIFELLRKVQPDEIYYLAAFHQSSEDKTMEDLELFHISYQVNVSGLLYFLEGIKQRSPRSKLFYAASSLIFGDADEEEQTELTPFRPNSIYGITKLDGLLACRYYREKYGVLASVGILYNHESEHRNSKFISMKIVEAAVQIKQGLRKELIVGDLSAEVDWGYAPDYIDAMHRILGAEKADEYIVATGEKHSVQDWVSGAFGYLGVPWENVVKENIQMLTRKRKPMRGNAEKLRKITGWKPTTSFKEMVEKMVESKQLNS